jgi:hypothetical protein
VMNEWRNGFMRWRSRDGPCGSHHDDASALKCDTSVGSTVPVLVEGLWLVTGVEEKHREAVGTMRCARCLRVVERLGVCEMHWRIERAAMAGL